MINFEKTMKDFNITENQDLNFFLPSLHLSPKSKTLSFVTQFSIRNMFIKSFKQNIYKQFVEDKFMLN